MQSSDAAPRPRVWVIQPHRSLTWREARRWLCLVSLVPLSSGLLFLAYGIPLVLPFAGLEILLLWAAFYYVWYTGQCREVVRLEGGRLVVEKGRDRPTETHQFDSAWVRVELRGQASGWYPSRLCLCSHGREVSLGHFLTEGERAELARSLINAICKSR
ncbi:MAG: DUF2244 domain-containing protein [Gammaproteobacteria bacterium]